MLYEVVVVEDEYVELNLYGLVVNYDLESY